MDFLKVYIITWDLGLVVRQVLVLSPSFLPVLCLPDSLLPWIQGQFLCAAFVLPLWVVLLSSGRLWYSSHHCVLLLLCLLFKYEGFTFRHYLV